MKYNKLFKGIFLAGLSLLLMTSCKDKEDSIESETTYYSITFNAAQPSEDGSEITAGQTWKSGDKVAAINIRSKSLIAPLTYNGSSFSGELTNLYSGVKLGFFYPYEAINFGHSDTIKYTINMAGQDGTEKSLKDYKTASTDTLHFDTNNATRVSGVMKTIQAKANFSFNYQGKPIPNIVRVELLAKEGNIYSQRIFNLRTQQWEKASSNSLVINNTNGLDGNMVISLLPTESVKFLASIETNSGMRYIGEATESTSIESGKIYRFTLNCEATDIKAHVGDYYYNDGSFSSSLDYGKTPVGIVFALSHHYGSDIDSNLDESLHGRVVSLKDLTTQKYRWAYQATLLYDMEVLKSYAGASSELESDSLAYLPYLRGNNPSTYYTDSCHVNLSIDAQSGSIKSWPTSGALSSFKGSENTALCDSSAIKYTAAYQTHSLVRAGIGNKRWYMPAAGELALLYELWRQQIITAATKPGFTDFQEFSYWSSDENNASSAWALNFFSGMIFRNNKMSSYYVRPCILF